VGAYGIMGGTFDPVHFGHLLMAERAREEFGLERVIFVPAGTPAHKLAWRVTDAVHRWNMVCLAIGDNGFFEASRIEIERPGPTYTVDTVEEFRRLWPDDEPYFIVGMDTVGEIPGWHRAQDLVRLTRFIAACRPGWDSDPQEALPAGFPARIHKVESPLMEISSTDIRERVRQGKSIRYTAPAAVVDYIQANRLYRDAND